MSRKRIPKHPTLKKLEPYLGPYKKPETFEEELMEYIDGLFMFGGFPSFMEACYDIKNILEEHNIKPDSDAGKSFFKQFVEHANEEFYGDIDMWEKCYKCGEEFFASCCVEYVYDVLRNKIYCDKCKAQKD